MSACKRRRPHFGRPLLQQQHEMNSVISSSSSVSRSRSVVWWVAALFVCALPLLHLVVWPQVFFGRSITAYVPSYWSDQVSYWRQIGTFKAVGMQGGYYTVNEQAAPLDSFRFYVHGPVYPMMMGTLAKFVNQWDGVTGLWFNAAFLTLALAVFIIGGRLSLAQILWTGAFIATTWTIPLYLASHMQESLHHAVAIVYALLFYKIFETRPNVPRRLSWVLMLVPLLLSPVRRWRAGSVLLALGGRRVWRHWCMASSG